MRKPAVKVSLVNDKNDPTNPPMDGEEFDRRAVLTAAMIDGRIQTAGRVVVMCILADTARRVIIARAT